MYEQIAQPILEFILGLIVGPKGQYPGRSFDYLEWAVLWAVSIAVYAVWATLAPVVGFPSELGLSTLLLRDGPLYAIVLVAIAWPVLATFANLIAGRVRPDAGAFCAAVGLLYLPCHGGDSRNTLLDANGHAAVYLLMMVELLALGAVAAMTVYGVPAVVGHALTLAGRGNTAADLDPDLTEEQLPDTLADRVTAVAVQAVATLLLTAVLVRTPLKGQAIAGVALAAFLSAALVLWKFPVRGPVWSVIGTVLAGLAAYALAFVSPANAPIGDVGGYLAGAARVLPLHYAAAGTAGAIFGYWTCSVWTANEED